MRVMITGRHVAITPALRRYIETRMKRLERFGGKLGNAQVVVGVEKYRHIAEASLSVNGARVQGKAATNEMYASIDQLLGKISRQVQKRKEKLVSHKVSGLSSLRPQRTREVASPSNLTTIQATLQTCTVAEAVENLREDSGDILIFFNHEARRVQVLRRVGKSGFELIDPKPPSGTDG